MVKPPASAPLDSLVDLACRDGVDIRPTLLRVLTDLYVQKTRHSAEEEIQYVELALGLIDAVDAQTRAAVAVSLSAYAGAPEAVLHKLAGTTQIQPSETGDRELIELFFSASPEERRLILLNLDVVPERSASRPMPAASELIRRLENAALQRNTGEFSRILERALGVSREMAGRIARDPFGEPLVVAAKGLGMGAETFQRILLFLDPAIGQSVDRVFELATLFDELHPSAAERMLAIWGRSIPRQQPMHATVYWDDERHPVRPAATRTSSTAQSERGEQPTGKSIRRRL